MTVTGRAEQWLAAFARAGSAAREPGRRIVLVGSVRQQVTGDGISVTLTAPDIADSIMWTLDQPEGVDVKTVVVRPIGAAR